MIKYVLFDLDGTLIHFDHTEFLSRYMHLLVKSKILCKIIGTIFNGLTS